MSEVKKEAPPSTEKEEKQIDCIITAKGSVYSYRDDGATQRYKTVEEKEYEPQLAIVFVPDYETLKRAAPPTFNVESILGEDESQYIKSLVSKIIPHGSRNYIVNASGTKLETNEQLDQETERIFLTFGTEEKVDFFIPVSIRPKIGYFTFDTRKYYDHKAGEWKRERHLGNKIVEIRYK